jgi:hypothetical protein
MLGIEVSALKQLFPKTEGGIGGKILKSYEPLAKSIDYILNNKLFLLFIFISI